MSIDGEQEQQALSVMVKEEVAGYEPRPAEPPRLLRGEGSPWDGLARARTWPQLLSEVPVLTVGPDHAQERAQLLTRLQPLLGDTPPFQYQLEAVWRMERAPAGGILALPPGVGKTFVCIMAMLLEIGVVRSSRPASVVSKALSAESSLQERAFAVCAKNGIAVPLALSPYALVMTVPRAGVRDVGLVRGGRPIDRTVLTMARVACLLIIPKVLVSQWLGEFALFCAPGCVTIKVLSKSKDCTLEKVQEAAMSCDVVVVTAEVFSTADFEPFQWVDWRLVVTDDSIAAATSNRMVRVAALVRSNCWVVSATPAKDESARTIENVLFVATGISLSKEREKVRKDSFVLGLF